MQISGKWVLSAPRQIELVGATVLTLADADQILEITSQSGADARLQQIYPHTGEGRTLFIWNNTGSTARMGRVFGEPGYLITPYDMPPQTILAGGVMAFRFYVDGGLPGSIWPTWHKI